MNPERIKADEYEMQYYGFTSTEIIVEFSECVEYYMNRALDSVEQAWIEKHPHYDINNIKAQIANVRKLYQSNMKGLVKKFQEAVEKIFHINPNVVLEGDEIYQKSYTDKEMAALKQEAGIIEEEFLRERLFLKRCRDHKNIFDKLKPIYEATNVKLKTVPSLLAADAKINQMNNFLKLQEDYVTYCCDRTSTQSQYYQHKHMFPTTNCEGTSQQ